MSRVVPALGACVLALASQALAATFVSEVVSYDPGDYAGPLAAPGSAVGAPAALTGEGTAFVSIVSPFNPPYEAAHLVGIGAGGHLTLRLGDAVSAVDGPEIGVFTNVGLIDVAFPTGVSASPAATFNALPRVADVAVSEDGARFVDLGRFGFANPSNALADAADPYAPAIPAGATPADPGRPFTGALADFSGLDWSGVRALLDGSAGGTWIDLSASGLAAVRFVRLSIPGAGIDGSDNRLFIDAVSGASRAVPEPGAALLAATAPAALRRRRR